MKDLFGVEVSDIAPAKKQRGPYQQWKFDNRYRRSIPGGNRCKTCKWMIAKQAYKRYYKCKLMGVSNCETTDIRLGNVCDRWEGKP